MKGTIQLVALGFSILLLLATCSVIADEPETVYIADGGHYAAGPFYAYGTMDLWVNMTVTDGGNVDVYIMTATQYENSYPYDSGESLSVSYRNSSVLNTASASIHYISESTDMYMGETLFVVVDNRNCTLTSDDATPTGRVNVMLEIDYTEDYYEYYPFDDFPIFLCTLVPIIAIIVIAAILIWATIYTGKSRQPPMLPYPAPPEPPKQ